MANLINVDDDFFKLEKDGGLVWDREAEIWTDENFIDDKQPLGFYYNLRDDFFGSFFREDFEKTGSSVYMAASLVVVISLQIM